MTPPDQLPPDPAASTDQASTEHVRVSCDGAVAWITLDRPEKRNAITRVMAGQMRSALADCAGNPQARVLVLTGTGSVFSAGADTRDLFGSKAVATRRDDGSDQSAGAGMLGERRSTDTPVFPVDELVLFPKPTIAALSGSAIGGGATMAMACDLRVMADDADITFSLGAVGLTPEWGSSYLLWRQIGWSRALDVLLTGRPVRADEALVMGLVSRVVPAADVVAETQSLAEQIASLPPGTAEEMKHVLRAGLDATYPDARRIELRTLSRRGRDLAALRQQKEQSQQ